MRPSRPSLLLVSGGVALVAAFAFGRAAPPAAPAATPDLSRLVAELSEPPGYFDTDNLVSNETAYLQVAEELAALPDGDVYLGVGPDQNYSYIARLRPNWAYVLDIRRQNMLQHLLFASYFEAADDPYQYLCLLLARSCPPRSPPRRGWLADELVAAVEAAPPDTDVLARSLADAYRHVQDALGFALTTEDREAMRSVARAFFDEQLELRFRSYRRSFFFHHPTYRALVLTRTPSGRYGHFLGSADDYRTVRELHRRRRAVPFVGDFAGPHALRALGRRLRERREQVAAFYVSNVEFYLLREEKMDAFAANLRELPWRKDAVLIRACFDYGRAHPAALAGHRSTTVLQRVDRFLTLQMTGAYRSYWDLCTLDYVRD